MSKVPSESEVLGYFKSLSNWGRWGDNDQKGTSNFLSRDKTKESLTLVKTGQTGQTRKCRLTVGIYQFYQFNQFYQFRETG